MRTFARVSIGCAVALVAFASGCGDDGPSQRLSASQQTGSESGSSAPASSTSVPNASVAGMPPTFFAETHDSRIAIVSSSTGEVARYLTEPQPGGGAGGFTLSPDGNTLFLSRGDGTCAGHVAMIDLVSGREGPIPGDSAPPNLPPPNAVDSGLSLRPDGGAVAFSRYRCDTRATDLVIIPLTGSPSAEVVSAGIGGPIGLRSWTQDGSQVIVTKPNVDDGTTSYSAIDVAANGSITGQHPITTPSHAGCNFSIDLVAPDSGQLISSERCGAQGPTDQVTLVEFDLATERVTHTLVTGPPGQILSPITLDSTGRYLLYETDESIPPGVVISDTNPAPPSQTWLLVDGTSTRFPQADAYGSLSWWS